MHSRRVSRDTSFSWHPCFSLWTNRPLGGTLVSGFLYFLFLLAGYGFQAPSCVHKAFYLYMLTWTAQLMLLVSASGNASHMVTSEGELVQCRFWVWALVWPERLYWSPAQGEACLADPGSTLFIIGVDNLVRQGCRPKPAHGIVFVFKSRRNVPYLKLITFIDNPAAFLTFTVLNASFVESQNVFIAPKDTSDMLSSVLPSSPACQLRT